MGKTDPDGGGQQLEKRQWSTLLCAEQRRGTGAQRGEREQMQLHSHTHHLSKSAGATISLVRAAAASSRVDEHRAREGLDGPVTLLVAQGGCFREEHACSRYLDGGSGRDARGGVLCIRNARPGSKSCPLNTITAYHRAHMYTIF